MPSEITRAADAFRAALLAGERAAAQALVEAYGLAWARIRAELDGLATLIAAAEAAGETADAGWLARQGHLRRLQTLVGAELAGWARLAGETIAAQQLLAAAAGADEAQALVRTALAGGPVGLLTFERLPAGAIAELVGVLGDGSPLAVLLDEFGPAAAAAARRELIAGVATGQGVPAIARRLRAALGTNLARALVVARTEVLRAYRESSRQTWLANADVVSGWMWVAARSTRTCAACWAMHGTFHPLDEPFGSHPNCRCTAVPITRSWAELGFAGLPETTPADEPGGADLFARLSPDEQRTVLGPGKYAAYRDGRIDLADLVHVSRDRRWGTTRREASLAEALGERTGQEAAD